MAPHPIQPHLVVNDGQKAIAWYKDTWGATQEMLQLAEDGTSVLHATLTIFGGTIMLHDAFPEFSKTVQAPTTLGASTATIHVNMAGRQSLDTAFDAAKTAGATIEMEPADMFWGAYYGRLIDPFGHSWSMGSQ
jgi:PhnB protein